MKLVSALGTASFQSTQAAQPEKPIQQLHTLIRFDSSKLEDYSKTVKELDIGINHVRKSHKEFVSSLKRDNLTLDVAVRQFETLV